MTWSTVHPPLPSGVGSIQGIGTGLVSGGTAVLPVWHEANATIVWLETSNNGGASWAASSAIRLPSPVQPQVDILSARTALVFTPHAVFATADGGATWTQATPTGSLGRLFSFSFTSARDGWALAVDPNSTLPSGILMATSNGGATWTQVPVTVKGGTSAQNG